MQISPRLRPVITRAPRPPAAAVMPLMATCALTAGLGVGILWGASRIGESRPQPAEPPAIVHQPAPTPVASDTEERPTALAVQPAVAEALAASDEAFQLTSPSPLALAVLDPVSVARLRAEAELPFTTIAAATPVAPATTPAPSRPATFDLAGRMAKIAPSSDGLPARVRARPTTSATILARIPIGAPLRVLGPADGARDWLRVTWKGMTGYVRADLVR